MSTATYKNTVSSEEKERVIREALNTPEGRNALLQQAQKTAQDIQKMMGYRAIGQRLLVVCEADDGNTFVHFNGEQSQYYAVNPISRQLQAFKVPDDLYVNMEDFPSVYFHKAYDYKTKRNKVHPAIIDSLGYSCVKRLAADINAFVIEAFISALPFRENKTMRKAASGKTRDIVQAILETSADVVAMGSILTKIVINPLDLPHFVDKYYIDEATTREIITTGLYGHVSTADIHVSSSVPVGTALCTANCEDLGEYVVTKSDAQGTVTNRVLGQSVNVCFKNIELIRTIEFGSDGNDE